jgi:hypothetical protein
MLPYKRSSEFPLNCCLATKFLVLLLTVVSIKQHEYVHVCMYSCLSHLACKLNSFALGYIFIYGFSGSTTHFPILS